MTSLKESLNEAASKLGKVGGSRNTPAQLLARQRNAALARAAKRPQHYKKPTAQAVLNRFMSRVVQLADEGCWIWTGVHKPEEKGAYPLFRDTREKSPRHAVAWAFEHIRRDPPPKRGSGLELSHQPDKCRFMSRCCNPFHCEIESREANLARRAPEVLREVCANARAHKGPPKKRSHCKNGHARLPGNLSPEGRCKTCITARAKARKAKTVMPTAA